MKDSTGKILSQAPCYSDLFEGGAHNKLADVIAREIQEDSNCTIIGIDGGWGSGKSNLVGLVENKLTNELKTEFPCQYFFFTYDAWGHQNDLPRRSILEELTSFVVSDDSPILEDDKWKTKLENLLARKRKTTTKVVPRLNFTIVTIALMVALTPVIASINSIIPRTIWRLIFSGLLYGSAIVFVVTKQIKSMKKNNQVINFTSFFEELFLLYQDKIKEDEKLETISEQEPSTKQFKEWMTDMDRDLKESSKNLVIVIDNMDRLPKLKVQELWSAIHSFFSETKYTNVKVIVPFDRSHIRNAFHSENIKNEDADIAVYGDDFINKTFYIVYHVAPPILSGWKSYFEFQWKEAFGKDAVVDNAVLQIYDLKTKEQTPRKILAFIDEFVTIKSIADPSVPDKYIALFIFGRTAIIKDPITEILVPTYLGPLAFLYQDDEEMPKYISSLYYQLPLADAVDVIYIRQFTRELDDNNIDSINLMKDKSLSKFNAILSRSLSEVSNTNNASLAMQTLFGNEVDDSIQGFWDCLYQKEKSANNKITLYMPYHKALLSHISDKTDYWKKLIRGYHNSITDSTDIIKYIKGIDELADIEEIKAYDFLSKIKKTITAEQFITLVSEKKGAYKNYGLTCDDKTLSDFLSNLDDIDALDKLIILPYLSRQEFPLFSFKKSIEDKLSSSDLDSSAAEILFARLKELEEACIDYSKFFDNNTLEKLYKSASKQFKADLIAMRLSAGNSYSSPYNYLAQALDDDSDSTIEKVAVVCNHYCDYGTILIGMETFNPQFVKKLCRFLTVQYDGRLSMQISKVVPKFDVIISNSDITKEELFNKMDYLSGDLEDMIKEIDVPNLPLSFFATAKCTNNKLATHTLKLANKYLTSLSQEEWEQYISEEDNMQLALLKIHHPYKIQPFFDAFKRLMKDYAFGKIEKSLPINNVNIIIAVSNDMKHDLVKLFMEIRDYFLTSTITLERLRYLGHWLFDYGNLDKKTGCLEKILPSEILDDTAIIEFMYKHKNIVKGMIANSINSSEFISKLQSMLSSSRKDDEKVKEICSYLGISIEESENSEELNQR